MKNHCLITTYYSDGGSQPSSEQLKTRFNTDCDVEDIYVNFANNISPFKMHEVPDVGATKRKDLVFCKIFLLNKFIKENILEKYEYICHIDYSDTKFCRSYNQMMQEIVSKNKNIIISTEKQCWPYIEAVSSWKPQDSSIVQKEFGYLNSGAVVSKTKILVEILNELEKLCMNTSIDFWDDQGVWQYYDIFIKPIEKDHTCEYFFSTGLLDNSYCTINSDGITTKFGTKPYLIHDNSSFSLNLIQKI